MSAQPDPLFFELFTEERKSLLLNGLESGYKTAQDCYEEARTRGANQYVFGYILYHYVVHELKQRVQAESYGFQILPDEETPTIQVQAR